MPTRTNDPTRRRYGVALLVGIIAGLVSAIVKFGWEVPFPPLTPERNATNPPQALLELLGMSPDTTHATYVFSGHELPYVSFIIHVGFAIAFAIIYCEIAEVTPLITIAQDAVFGIVVWFVFHVVIFPAMGVVPAPWNQPFAEHVSEFFGHALWMWVIEIFRRDLRNRISHQPDPWVPLPADR